MDGYDKNDVLYAVVSHFEDEFTGLDNCPKWPEVYGLIEEVAEDFGVSLNQAEKDEIREEVYGSLKSVG